MYTEIQKRNNKNYYYLVKSIRKGEKIKKIRKFLGVNLSKKELLEKESEAKIFLDPLNSLLNKDELKELNSIKEKYSKISDKTFENRYESFLARFTYDSNAIEGNTLSLKETSYILFDGRTPEGKSLREINEVLNHKKAFDFMLEYKKDITKIFICKLQSLIVANTLKKDLESQAGRYRDLQVYIRGANFVPPNPKEAKKEMKTLLFWYSKNKNQLHPLILAAYFHAAFESIHPFVDGNGRTGRLLLNFILHKYEFPMINLPNSKRLSYYECLEESRKGDLRKFVKFLFDLIKETEIYV
ncbi:Fic family protein [Candidatus Woesearchaeota archaeon]|nr:Fic family protein [Candidatus Woesearchaeota archaeon]